MSAMLVKLRHDEVEDCWREQRPTGQIEHYDGKVYATALSHHNDVQGGEEGGQEGTRVANHVVRRFLVNLQINLSNNMILFIMIIDVYVPQIWMGAWWPVPPRWTMRI